MDSGSAAASIDDILLDDGRQELCMAPSCTGLFLSVPAGPVVAFSSTARWCALC